MADWQVVLLDGLSRCAPAGSPDQSRSIAEGWEPLPGIHATRFEGWTHAVVGHGAMPEDYDDRMKPGLIWQPTELFRSVSPAELLDIAATRSVTGAGNAFNDFDRRPFVFFSATMSEACLGQGEDVDRAAWAALRDHALHGEMRRLERRRQRAFEAVGPSARLHAEAVDRLRAARGRAPCLAPDADWSRFSDPNSDVFRIAMRDFPGKAAFDAELRAVGAERQRLLDLHRDLVLEARDRLRSERDDGGPTSAVIRTVPIALGYRYSTEHGLTGMNGEDEYGLFPGQVRVADIVDVTLVRGGVPGEATSLDDAVSAMRSRVATRPVP